MVGTTPATAQTPCGGPVSTCCVPGSPTRPAPWPWTSPCRPGGQAAPQPGRRPSVGPGRRWTSWQPGTANRRTIASRQARCRRPPARGHRGHLDPLRPAGGPPHPTTPGPARRGPRGGSAADSAGLSVRTPEHRTPGHRTPDTGHPLDGLDGRPRRDRGADRATTSVAGVRTSSRRRPRLGGPTSPGSQRLGALGHPGRPRGDGTCAGGPDRRRH
jgi:hypothetical protein